jgi:nitric oxide reductase large subunit|tara:strand:- start:116 stop:424 length:309 start_codon:yes stop_codon:yes gene_type:complete
MIIEYKMHMTAGGMRTPEWVEDGGYFLDTTENTMVGWSPDEADREYYIPDTVTELTATELETKVLAQHTANKYQKTNDDGTTSDMTNAEVKTMVSDWVAARS